MAAPEFRYGPWTDLNGRRLGIAGSPLDKSWLLLRVFASRSARARPGPRRREDVRRPAAAGRTARRGPAGRRADLLAVCGAGRGARAADGVGHGGRACRRSACRRGCRCSVTCSRTPGRRGTATRSGASWPPRGRRGRCSPGRTAEWQRIAPLTGASDQQELARLHAWYRRGLPGEWDATQQAAAERLYDMLAEAGGSDLVGPATHLAKGTFWAAE